MGTSPKLKLTERLTRTDTPADPDQKSQRQPERKPLGAQKNDFRKRHEDRDGR